MPHFAFIDESGTLPDQEVMTVALVLLEGVRSAEKMHLKLAKAVFQPPKARGLAERERWYGSQKLHYVDMNDRQRHAMGEQLARANIAAVIANYWHTEHSATHEHRFYIYKQLVKTSILRAFEHFDDLVVSVSKQGGWESYGAQFLQELRLLPEQFTREGHYRKGQFYLASPAKPGQQIADYFASSSRNFLLARTDATLARPYELVQHHVRHFDEHKLAQPLLKEK